MDTSCEGEEFMQRAFWMERPPVELPLGGHLNRYEFDYIIFSFY
jgi:hypothetical protein